MKNNIYLSTILLQMKNSFARKTFQFTLLVQPVLYTLITYYMFLHSGVHNYVSYVILGSGLLSLWSCIVFSSAGDIDRERWMGTLSFIYATPTSFIKLIFAKIIGNTLLSLAPFLISFITVTFIFQQPVFILHKTWLLISCFLSLFSFISIAFLFSAIFTLSRKASIIMNCLEYPIFILCGMAFPIDILPKQIQYVSSILSPTWAVKILRECIQGIVSWDRFYIELIFLIILTLIYFIFAHFLFLLVDNKVRKNATLEVC